MTSKIQKITLVFFGLFSAFVLLEIIIRVYVFNLNRPRSFQYFDKKTYEMVRTNHELKRGYERDNRAEYFTNLINNNTEIYALGDSFTNGGNLPIEDSYPYQLFSSIKGKATVKNYGVCESSSHDVLKRLKKVLTKNQAKSSRQIYLILTGAVDLFEVDKTQSAKRSNLYEKAEFTLLEPNHFFGLKSFKLISMALDIALEKKNNLAFRRDIQILDKLKDFTNEPQYENCFWGSYSKQADCFTTLINNEFTNHEDRAVATKQLASYLRDYRAARGSYQKPKAIKSLMSFVKANENFLDQEDMIDYLGSLWLMFRSQSKLSSEEYLKELLRVEAGLENRGINPKTMALISNLKATLKNEGIIKRNREKHIRKIIELIKDHKKEVYLLTYPIDYPDVNETIRKVARDFKTPLIDLQKIFMKHWNQNQKQLITNGEHCTKDGYKLMAESIKNALEI